MWPLLILIPVVITTGGVKIREKYNGVWQNSESVGISLQAYVVTDNNNLHLFFYDHGDVPLPHGYPHYYLSHDYTNLNNHNWYNNYSNLVDYGTGGPPDQIYRLDLSKTVDNSIHSVYDGATYIKWDGSQFTDQFTFGNGTNNKTAPNSNDIYVAWIESGYIRLRQRDFAPLAPQNLTRSIVGQNNNPRIDWDVNGEADLDKYEVWKKKGSGNWDSLATSTSTTYTDATETGVSLNPQANNVEILYRVEAVDLEGNHSDPSTAVTFNQSGGDQDKIAANSSSQNVLPDQFVLYQNHPNPFNPTTTIRFTIPEAQEVEVAVYNLSGQKIITLAKGVMEEGIHQVEWNGKDAQGRAVSSGLYIYQLKAGKHRMVKKMLLTK